MTLLPAFTASKHDDLSAFENKVFCCDALDLLAALPDASVDMILTDIPYGEVNNSNETHTSIRRLHRGDADTVNFDLEKLLSEFHRVSKYWVYVFCGLGQISTIRNFWNPGYMVRVGAWQKANPSPLNGQHIWLSGLEYCVVIRKKNAPFNEFCKQPLWQFPIYQDKRHPTAKPPQLFEYLINSSSVLYSTILDPFAGSGTTALAAKKTGRKFICSDISQEYVDLARNRIQATDPFQDTVLPDGTKQLSLFSDEKLA